MLEKTSHYPDNDIETYRHIVHESHYDRLPIQNCLTVRVGLAQGGLRRGRS